MDPMADPNAIAQMLMNQQQTGAAQPNGAGALNISPAMMQNLMAELGKLNGGQPVNNPQGDQMTGLSTPLFSPDMSQMSQPPVYAPVQ
jgi:hypothetical protein